MEKRYNINLEYITNPLFGKDSVHEKYIFSGKMPSFDDTLLEIAKEDPNEKYILDEKNSLPYNKLEPKNSNIFFKAKDISSNVSALFEKDYHLVTDLNNTLWSFGTNVGLALGLRILDPTIDKKIHMPIWGLKIKKISAGFHHNLAIDMEDNVWAFGSNRFGQLGLGDDKKMYDFMMLVVSALH